MIEQKQSDTPQGGHEGPVKPEDERAPMARAMGVAHEVIAISLEMSLIPLGGYWLDQKLGLGPLFLLLGCLLGFSLGFYHLMRFASAMSKENKR